MKLYYIKSADGTIFESYGNRAILSYKGKYIYENTLYCWVGINYDDDFDVYAYIEDNNGNMITLTYEYIYTKQILVLKKIEPQTNILNTEQKVKDFCNDTLLLGDLYDMKNAIIEIKKMQRA